MRIVSISGHLTFASIANRAPVALVAMLACMCMPARAPAAGPHDVRATSAYLAASALIAHSESRVLATMVAAIEARANAIAGTCPGALAFAPRDAAFGEVEEELGQTLFFAGTAPLRTELLRLARSIGGLRWGERRLTRLVRARTVEERTDAMLVLPDVCTQIEAWRASAYATVPQSVNGFTSRLRTLESSAFVGRSGERREVVILRLLRRYEGQAERRLAKRVERLEARVGRRLSQALQAVDAKLAAALGVSTI
jgi:hypothetical protein